MQQQLQQQLTDSLTRTFAPHYLKIDNDSHLHQGQRTYSHFKVLIVSDAFAQLNRVKRHQQVYQALGGDFMKRIHALQLNTWTIKEWLDNSKNELSSSTCHKNKPVN